MAHDPFNDMPTIDLEARRAAVRRREAADDLLAALEQSVLYVETLHSLMTQDGRKTPATLALMANIRASRAAIAKATGQ